MTPVTETPPARALRRNRPDGRGLLRQLSGLDGGGPRRAVQTCGFNYRDMEREDGLPGGGRIALRYRSPARFDDEVIVKTWIEEANTRMVTFAYEMRLAEDDRRLATGYTRHVFVSRAMRPPPAGQISRPVRPGVKRWDRPSLLVVFLEKHPEACPVGSVGGAGASACRPRAPIESGGAGESAWRKRLPHLFHALSGALQDDKRRSSVPRLLST